jgi:hypothetical protein
MNTFPRRYLLPNRPEPLSNQDALDLVGFINENDPRYTARWLTTGHTDYKYRAQCFRRDTGGHALLYHSIQGYGADARRQVEDPEFLAALTRWVAARN